MNYIKEAENYLRYYHDLYRSVENMNRRISQLIAKAGPKKLTAIALDETGIKAGHHDETINILFEIQKLTEAKGKTLEELKQVERLLEDISQEPGCELYGQVLKAWYIERKTKEAIAEDTGYSFRGVYDIRNRAIRKFAITLFGIDALKVV